MSHVPPMLCKLHRVPECPQCKVARPMNNEVSRDLEPGAQPVARVQQTLGKSGLPWIQWLSDEIGRAMEPGTVLYTRPLAATEAQPMATRKPDFWGFLDAEQCRIDLCYSPAGPGSGGRMAMPLWTTPQPAAAPEAQPALTFDAFRAANVARCLKWHPKGLDSWSTSDWLTAVTGELGELASLLKMRNRERDGLPGNKFSPTDKQVADELADVLTYLDLLAAVLGVDLGRAAVAKFNEVSERVGFPDRIPAPEARPAASEPK